MPLTTLVSSQLPFHELTAGSYGSLARFRDIQRLHPLGTHTILGAAGDMSDFQWLKKELDALLYDLTFKYWLPANA